jgi:hypothetical protein
MWILLLFIPSRRVLSLDIGKCISVAELGSYCQIALVRPFGCYACSDFQTVHP